MKVCKLDNIKSIDSLLELTAQENEPFLLEKNGKVDNVLLNYSTFQNILNKKAENTERISYVSSSSNNFGYIDVSSSTLHLEVANVDYNAKQIIEVVKTKAASGIKVLAFPELSLSSYSCGDLFLTPDLINGCLKGIQEILEATKNEDVFFAFGSPIQKVDQLFNCAICCYKGEILGIVPKANIPNYGEFYERRYFAEGTSHQDIINLFGKNIPFSTDLLFQNKALPQEVIALEICEDLWVPASPSIRHALSGATIILNLSASNEVIGKQTYRRDLVKMASAKLMCAYIYASASEDESTTDLLFSGACFIGENGTILKESKLFSYESIDAVIDLDMLVNRRIMTNSFKDHNDNSYKVITFNQIIENKTIKKDYDKMPFIPVDKKSRYERILEMQAYGLVKRLRHTHLNKMVLGLSGGLDSTLAFLVCLKAAQICNLGNDNIIAISMPCFATSNRTKNNARKLAEISKVTFKEIDISKSVQQHLEDIDYDISKKDVTYENAQARERTQVLMDYANKENGLVIGTGDLSEIALGWSTYNGDHMSMYAVNASIPKTLVRDMVAYYAREGELKEALIDILDTPISPELIPGENGKISQKTEDIVGPYELHDFFLYHFIRNHFTVLKIYYMALKTFKEYDAETIKKWLKVFIKRFFTQQFKRSCMPDGVKIGTVSLSPRGDLRMPSDAKWESYLKELDNL